MSSNDGVFLYVGIVAIWAGFLIPAWLRRPAASDVDVEADVDADYRDHDDGELGESEEFAAAAAQPAPSPAPAGRRSATAWPSPGASQSWEPGGWPSPSRQQTLRARRRMLTILVALSLITGGFVASGLVQWWICVPPIGMLVLYVLLLREIAMADAELAAKRSAWEAREAYARVAGQERLATHQREGEQEAAAAEPDAQIIDIFGRAGDELYDQYADAAVRAVGD